VGAEAGNEGMELLKRVREEWDQTLVVVTHSPRVAAYADRVYFLKDGSVVDESPLDSERNLELIWRGMSMN